MIARRLALAVALLGLTAATGCIQTPSQREAQEQRLSSMQERLEDIQGQLFAVNEQLSDIRQTSAPPPAPRQGGLVLQPEREVVPVQPQEPSTPRRRFEMLDERTRPVVAQRGSGTRASGGESRTGLAAKHVKVNVPVRTVQSALRNAGFNPGPIDGKVGERTIAAIRAFQGAQGLTVDGVVGPRTWARLRNYSGAEK